MRYAVSGCVDTVRNPRQGPWPPGPVGPFGAFCVQPDSAAVDLFKTKSDGPDEMCRTSSD